MDGWIYRAEGAAHHQEETTEVKTDAEITVISPLRLSRANRVTVRSLIMVLQK